MKNQGAAPDLPIFFSKLLVSSIMLLGLAACGGGGDSGPGISVDSPSVVEGDGGGGGQLTFTLSLSKAVDDPVSVQVATADGSAEAATDYTERSGETVSFSAGSTSATFTVDITGDDDYEADETLSLVLSNPNGISLSGTTQSASGTINNDDDADPKGYFAGSGTFNGVSYDDVTALVYDKRILMFSPTANVLYDITMATPTIEDYSGTVDVYVAGQIDSSGTVSVSGQTDEADLRGTFNNGASNSFGEGSFTVTFDPDNNAGAGTDYSRIEADPIGWQGDFHSVDTVGATITVPLNGYWGGGANANPVCAIQDPTVPLSIPSSQVNIFQVSNDIRNVLNCQYGYMAPYDAVNRYSGFASVINVTGTDDGLVFVETNGSYSIYAIMARP